MVFVGLTKVGIISPYWFTLARVVRLWSALPPEHEGSEQRSLARAKQVAPLLMYKKLKLY